MSQELVTTTAVTSVAHYSESAMSYARKSKSAHTLTAYRSLLGKFYEWRGDVPIVPADGRKPAQYKFARAEVSEVVDYIAFLADEGKSSATIYSSIAALKWAHEMNAVNDPTAHPDVMTVFQGVRNDKADRKPRKAQGLEPDALQAMVNAIPDTLTGKRDRAVLLVGFAGAFRRSELVGLKWDDLEVGYVRVRVRVGKSKTDQEGKGKHKVLPKLQNESLCPVRALRDWQKSSGIETGYVFRNIDQWEHISETGLTAQSVSLIVKKYAKLAGLNPRKFSGHSLRRGFVNAALDNGATPTETMQQTGHESQAFQEYVDENNKQAEKAVRLAFGETA